MSQSAVSVTIVVTHRERFSFCRPSLESVYANTRMPFSLVYVDSGSPPHVRRFIAAEAHRLGFTVIRSEEYLAQNVGRNLALAHVKTPYVVLMDSDVVFAPGCLDALMRCAEETGAAATVPVYCIGEPLHQTVHVAGTKYHFTEKDGARTYQEEHTFANEPLVEARRHLKRELCDGVEMHTVLLRREVLERFGGLDEAILGTRDHVDLSFELAQAGLPIYLEPEAVVTYFFPPTTWEWSDVPFYLLRWSDAWNEASLQHLCRKWNLANDHRVVVGSALRPHRQAALMPLRRRLVRLAGWRLGNGLVDALEGAVVLYARRKWRRLPA